MIKVNLLESVTDRTGGVASVEARVASPRAQGRLVMLAVAGLLIGGMTFDWMSARSARNEAQQELARQQEVAGRMEAIKKEMGELEKRTQEINTRIDAIKKLRSAQQGPVAVLSFVNERLPRVQDFRLESIEQKGDQVIVKGDSPDEGAVTQFGRSMEFSTGLFTNVSIEIKRETMELPKEASAASGATSKDAAKPTTVAFTLKCKYTAPGTTNASQQQKATAQPVGQVAKNN